MERKIINIDRVKCNGCGACAAACHEGAIKMIDGIATLVRDDYCDGLGDCLPVCPADAISFVIREAAPYDEAAVLAKKFEELKKDVVCGGTGCPGEQASEIIYEETAPAEVPSQDIHKEKQSCLSQWPVQIKLAPVKAPYFENSKLLIAADCTAYAYASFHQDFIKGRITLVGCPKLDATDYSEKLAEIIRENNIKSVLVVRMEVPCCGGLETATKKALQESGKFIPWQVVTISTDGKIIED